jgi:hypothetical protein
MPERCLADVVRVENLMVFVPSVRSFNSVNSFDWNNLHPVFFKLLFIFTELALPQLRTISSASLPPAYLAHGDECGSS